MSDETNKPKERPAQVGQPNAPEAKEPKESKAQQDRDDEYRRTGRVPKGYVFNVYRGVHKRGT